MVFKAPSTFADANSIRAGLHQLSKALPQTPLHFHCTVLDCPHTFSQLCSFDWREARLVSCFDLFCICSVGHILVDPIVPYWPAIACACGTISIMAEQTEDEIDGDAQASSHGERPLPPRHEDYDLIDFKVHAALARSREHDWPGRIKSIKVLIGMTIMFIQARRPISTFGKMLKIAQDVLPTQEELVAVMRPDWPILEPVIHFVSKYKELLERITMTLSVMTGFTLIPSVSQAARVSDLLYPRRVNSGPQQASL